MDDVGSSGREQHLNNSVIAREIRAVVRSLVLFLTRHCLFVERFLVSAMPMICWDHVSP